MAFVDHILQPMRESGSGDDDGISCCSSDAFRVLAHDLGKTFQQGDESIPVLESISLDILEGEFFAIIGRSGTGKTTLLKILAGCERPTQGTVRVFGRDPLAGHEADFWYPQTIGYVPQKRTWSYGISVLDTLELPLRAASQTGSKWLNRAMDALELLGIAELAPLFPEELTVSEQTRLAVAHAVAVEPRLLLLDQVGSRCDSATTLDLFKVLKQLNEQKGTTVIVTACDDRVARFAIRSQILADGCLSVFRNDKWREISGLPSLNARN